MANADEHQPELDRLERDAERSRAKLTQTVDHLGEKLSETMSPAALKHEVSDYVSRSGQQAIDSMKRKAFDNPLLAVSIAAAMGYPIWNAIAKMPVPVLLVGAGVAVSGSSNRVISSSHSPEPNTAVTDKVTNAAATAAERVKETGDTLLQSYDRNPLVVGGIGIALGALLGAALPRTSAEDQGIGALNQQLQQRTNEAFQEVTGEFTDAVSREPGPMSRT